MGSNQSSPEEEGGHQVGLEEEGEGGGTTTSPVSSGDERGRPRSGGGSRDGGGSSRRSSGRAPPQCRPRDEDDHRRREEGEELIPPPADLAAPAVPNPPQHPSPYRRTASHLAAAAALQQQQQQQQQQHGQQQQRMQATTVEDDRDGTMMDVDPADGAEGVGGGDGDEGTVAADDEEEEAASTSTSTPPTSMMDWSSHGHGGGGGSSASANLSTTMVWPSSSSSSSPGTALAARREEESPSPGRQQHHRRRIVGLRGRGLLGGDDQSSARAVSGLSSLLFPRRWSSIPTAATANAAGSSSASTSAPASNDSSPAPSTSMASKTKRRKNKNVNVVRALWARETTGLTTSSRYPDLSQALGARGNGTTGGDGFTLNRLRSMGGTTLYQSIDRPSGGMPSEVVLLNQCINRGDWDGVSSVVDRIAPRLIGEYGDGLGGGGHHHHQMGAGDGGQGPQQQPQFDDVPAPAAPSNGNGGGMMGRSSSSFSPLDGGDPALAPATRWRGRGGYGRSGFERDAFVLSGGVETLIRVFYERCFVVDGWRNPHNHHVGGVGGESSSRASEVAAAWGVTGARPAGTATPRGGGGEKKRRRRRRRLHRNSRSHHPRPLVIFRDAREMTEEYVSTKLANTWNEALTVLRELIFHVPEILDRVLHMPLARRHLPTPEDDLGDAGGSSSADAAAASGSDGGGEFLPWLFTLLSHDSCFDAAAALIEEILSLQSQASAAPLGGGAAGETHDGVDDQEAVGPGGGGPAGGGPPPASLLLSVSPGTFYLGDVADLYDLWGNFSCRQLAHFCRILALLVFEPEDRHLMESPAMLKSMELLRLRRDRSARAGGLLGSSSAFACSDGCDSDSASYVDRNQAIVLGDETLCLRLINLLRIMNYAPDLRRTAPYHVITHLPWIADTLVMLGLNEMEDWDDLDRLDALARRSRKKRGRHRRRRSRSGGGGHGDGEDGRGGELDNGSDDGNDDVEGGGVVPPSELGSVADMLESLAGTLLSPSSASTSSMSTTHHATHLSHIIHVINAAQAAGVVINRRQQRRTRQQQGGGGGNRWQVQVEVRREDPQGGGDSPTVQGVARSALSLTDQLFFRRRASPAGAAAGDDGGNGNNDEEEEDDSVMSDAGRVDAALRGSTGGVGAGMMPPNLRTSRYRISRPEDAANELQFNALLLAPYQVEVLFVLCTLLGGRRKLDAQAIVASLGMVSVLDEMFDRLSWGPPSDHVPDGSSSGAAENNAASSPSYQHQHQEHQHQQGGNNGGGAGAGAAGGGGIHGPGCECNPESALRVQYLRLIHNFCDKDCDNYGGRRLLLSQSERELVFGASSNPPPPLRGKKPTPRRAGLLSKVMDAFVREPDDSPYKFWLSSCVESYLRGSSPNEQIFVAKSGLLRHLLHDVLSDRLHCAGGLQTSFDLMGEICKGNPEAVGMLLADMDESRFRRLMSVAAANLVDSNVFLRALILTMEKMEVFALNQNVGLHAAFPSSEVVVEPSSLNESGLEHQQRVEQASFRCAAPNGVGYLTHSWWDVPSVGTTAVGSSKDVGEALSRHQRAPQTPLGGGNRGIECDDGISDALMVTDMELIGCGDVEIGLDRQRQSDWFVPIQPEHESLEDGTRTSTACSQHATSPLATTGSGHGMVAHGQVSPRSASLLNIGDAGWKFSPNERIHHHHAPPHGIGHDWTTTLSKEVADHPNPDAYRPNTLARLAWFLVANQSRLLRDLLGVVDLRNINHENICCLNTAIVVAIFANRRTELPRVVDELRWMNVVSSVSSLDLQMDGRYEADATYVASLRRSIGGRKADEHPGTSTPLVGDRSDVLRNFRELLWFWIEYYTHRGRDRLSLEFSSHLRFGEWMDVVSMLCADDGSKTSLVSKPIPLPRSPYRRAPRWIEGRWRTA